MTGDVTAPAAALAMMAASRTQTALSQSQLFSGSIATQLFTVGVGNCNVTSHTRCGSWVGSGRVQRLQNVQRVTGFYIIKTVYLPLL
jgi:hypothetical protein